MRELQKTKKVSCKKKKELGQGNSIYLTVAAMTIPEKYIWKKKYIWKNEFSNGVIRWKTFKEDQILSVYVNGILTPEC